MKKSSKMEIISSEVPLKKEKLSYYSAHWGTGILEYCSHGSAVFLTIHIQQSVHLLVQKGVQCWERERGGCSASA